MVLKYLEEATFNTHIVLPHESSSCINNAVEIVVEGEWLCSIGESGSVGEIGGDILSSLEESDSSIGVCFTISPTVLA